MSLYPVNIDVTCFKVGDWVRKVLSDQSVTPYIGVVTHIVPSTNKIWVQWPLGNLQEDPEFLLKVPFWLGCPTAKKDYSYDSYEKGRSEKNFGRIPKRDVIEPAKSKVLPRVLTARQKQISKVVYSFLSNKVLNI